MASKRTLPSSKPSKDDPTNSASNFKEIQRLRKENQKLDSELISLKEELQRKEEFAAVFTKFGDDRFDLRRMNMYKAKVAKQERIVNPKQIFLMQTALDAQRALYFEMENIIGGIGKLLKNTERPEQTVLSIGSVIKPALKMLRDAESSAQVAYSQLLTSRKIADTVEIVPSGFPEWKTAVKVSGQEIYELEVCLSQLFLEIVQLSNTQAVGKVREACSKLLRLGIQLPLTNTTETGDFFDSEAKKLILLSAKSANKNEVKEIVMKLINERKKIKLEKELMEKEIECKFKEISELEMGIRELKKDIEGKCFALRGEFESNLMKPFDDVWKVFQNIEQSSAVQLYVVFKMHAGKMKQFIDSFINFKI
jgi:hypothetical protein